MLPSIAFSLALPPPPDDAVPARISQGIGTTETPAEQHSSASVTGGRDLCPSSRMGTGVNVALGARTGGDGDVVSTEQVREPNADATYVVSRILPGNAKRPEPQVTDPHGLTAHSFRARHVLSQAPTQPRFRGSQSFGGWDYNLDFFEGQNRGIIVTICDRKLRGENAQNDGKRKKEKEDRVNMALHTDRYLVDMVKLGRQLLLSAKWWFLLLLWAEVNPRKLRREHTIELLEILLKWSEGAGRILLEPKVAAAEKVGSLTVVPKKDETASFFFRALRKGVSCPKMAENEVVFYLWN
ncbi:hypothetical protein R3P38DRAFT_2812219 [Favolaschia claudopus]|uniref:Uncharacterized protein n=1 Tax=Favolaschia claudopus TaxID=2862362 RepID=A0AAV9Z8U1_9AGAR